MCFCVYVVFVAAVDFLWVVPCIWAGRRLIWPGLTLFRFRTTSLALCVYMKQVQCVLNGIWRDRHAPNTRTIRSSARRTHHAFFIRIFGCLLFHMVYYNSMKKMCMHRRERHISNAISTGLNSLYMGLFWSLSTNSSWMFFLSRFIIK